MKKQPVIFLFLIAAILISLGSCSKPQGFEYRGIHNLRLNTLDFNRSEISLELVYFNPNNFGVTLKNVTADIYLNKNYMGKYILDTTLFIAKRSEFSLPSTMEVDMRNLLKNALTGILGNEVLLDVSGTTRVGKSGIYINVPISYSGRHKISLF